jgi:acetyl-CoA synthetase
MMSYAVIKKSLRQNEISPLPIGWEAARARLEGLRDGGLNIAHEAVDRHVAADHGAGGTDLARSGR